MPRRNHRDTYRPAPIERSTDWKPDSPEAMARDLVRRGLATPRILTGDNRRRADAPPTERNDDRC